MGPLFWLPTRGRGSQVSGGGGPAWTPDMLLDKTLWLRGDDQSGAENALMSTVVDSSGAGNNCTASGADQPQFATHLDQGHSGIIFTSSNKLTPPTGAMVSGAAARTFAMCFRSGYFPGVAALFSWGNFSAAGDGWDVYTVNGGLFWNDAVNQITLGTLDINEVTRIIQTYDGATIKSWVNGTLVDTTTTALNTGSANRIIGNAPSPNQGFAGIIYETIITSHAINSSDVASLDGYLKKYARVSGETPGGTFPYRTNLIGEFFAGSSTQTNGNYVFRLPNTGTGKDALSAQDGTRRPVKNSTGINGHPSLIFNGASLTLGSMMRTPDVTATGAFTIVILAKVSSLPQPDNDNGRMVTGYPSPYGPAIGELNSKLGGANSTTIQIYVGQWFIGITKNSGSGAFTAINRSAPFLSDSTTTYSPTEFHFGDLLVAGGNTTNGRLDGEIAAIGIYNEFTSDSNDALNIAYLASFAGLAFMNIVFDGNSITQLGAGQWVDMAASGDKFVNIGVSGQTTEMMTADVVSQITPLLDNSGNFIANVYVGWELTNDIVGNNASAATAFAALITLCETVRSAFPTVKILVGKCIARSQDILPPDFNTRRADVNALIDADNLTHWDMVAEIAGLIIDNDADAADLSLSGDGVHWQTVPGQAAIANSFKTALDQLHYGRPQITLVDFNGLTGASFITAGEGKAWLMDTIAQSNVYVWYNTGTETQPSGDHNFVEVDISAVATASAIAAATISALTTAYPSAATFAQVNGGGTNTACQITDATNAPFSGTADVNAGVIVTVTQTGVAPL